MTDPGTLPDGIGQVVNDMRFSVSSGSASWPTAGVRLTGMRQCASQRPPMRSSTTPSVRRLPNQPSRPKSRRLPGFHGERELLTMFTRPSWL